MQTVRTKPHFSYWHMCSLLYVPSDDVIAIRATSAELQIIISRDYNLLVEALRCASLIYSHSHYASFYHSSAPVFGDYDSMFLAIAIVSLDGAAVGQAFPELEFAVENASNVGLNSYKSAVFVPPLRSAMPLPVNELFLLCLFAVGMPELPWSVLLPVNVFSL